MPWFGSSEELAQDSHCLPHLVNSLVLYGSVLLASTSLASLFLLRNLIVAVKGGGMRKVLEVDTMWLFLGETCTNIYSAHIGTLGTIKETTPPKSSFVNCWIYWDNLQDHGRLKAMHMTEIPPSMGQSPWSSLNNLQAVEPPPTSSYIATLVITFGGEQTRLVNCVNFRNFLRLANYLLPKPCNFCLFPETWQATFW